MSGEHGYFYRHAMPLASGIFTIPNFIHNQVKPPAFFVPAFSYPDFQFGFGVFPFSQLIYKSRFFVVYVGHTGYKLQVSGLQVRKEVNCSGS